MFVISRVTVKSDEVSGFIYIRWFLMALMIMILGHQLHNYLLRLHLLYLFHSVCLFHFPFFTQCLHVSFFYFVFPSFVLPLLQFLLSFPLFITPSQTPLLPLELGLTG